MKDRVNMNSFFEDLFNESEEAYSEEDKIIIKEIVDELKARGYIGDVEYNKVEFDYTNENDFEAVDNNTYKIIVSLEDAKFSALADASFSGYETPYYEDDEHGSDGGLQYDIDDVSLPFDTDQDNYLVSILNHDSFPINLGKYSIMIVTEVVGWDYDRVDENSFDEFSGSRADNTDEIPVGFNSFTNTISYKTVYGYDASGTVYVDKGYVAPVIIIKKN